MVRLELRQIGTSVGVILPKEVLASLEVDKGDELFLTEVPGGIRLTAHDPTLEEQIELGREFTKEYRETFRALAR